MTQYDEILPDDNNLNTSRPRPMAEFDCAWCSALNPLAYHFCHRCGHAAHRERHTCDCAACGADRAARKETP